MSETAELLRVLADVRSALTECGVKHVFIGALPVLAWGRPRATTDVDVVVFADPAQFQTLSRAFVARHMTEGRHIGPAEPSDPLPDIAVFWARTIPPVRVDVFIGKMDFERVVLERGRSANVLGEELRLAAPEASIIYKLIAYRAKDVADIEAIFESRASAKDSLDWQFLDRWAREWGIEDRLEPYRRRFGSA